MIARGNGVLIPSLNTDPRDSERAMTHIILALFPLVMLIALGFILNKYHFLAEGFWSGAERLNYYLLFPALFINTLAFAEIDFGAVQSLLIAMLGVFLIATAGLYGFKFLHKTPRARFGVHVQSVVRFNSYISLALVAALYQHDGMLILAILLAAGVPVVNIISVLSLTADQHMSFKSVLLSLVKNPLIISCLVGITLNILNIHIWRGLQELLKLLSASSLPLGLICVGAALRFGHMQKDALALLANTVLRLLAMPLLAYGICQLLQLPPLQTQVLVVFFALPTATAAYILTKVLGGDSQLMAKVISVQTVCAALSLPLVVYLVAQLG
jgi:malonate transporter